MPSQETLGAQLAELGERSRMDTVTVPVDQDEIMHEMEQFYVPASLEENDVFCGDEREPAGVTEPYIHWFGGILKPVYNLAILKEATQPSSVTDTFEDRVRSTIPVLRDVAKVNPGVHSDDTCEAGDQLDIDKTDGDVGCGYADKRAGISQLIAQTGTDIISDAMTLQPELFESAQDFEHAKMVVRAHASLAERETFFTSGRKVVLTAVEQGSKSMVVKGAHVGETGVINRDPASTIDSGEAFKAGLPTYNQDAGLLEQVYDRIHHLYPYDKRLVQIAELIDTIGTMRALGVKDIAVRNAKQAA